MSVSPLRELAAVLSLLKSRDVPHALIGGWAVIAWGFLRASDDFDLLIDLPRSKRKELLAALAENYEAEWIEGGKDDPITGLLRAKPRGPGLPVDMIQAGGRADRGAISAAIEIEVEEMSIPIVPPAALIAMKLEAGGGQDYEDAKRLIEVLGERLDAIALEAACRERRVLDRLALIRR